MNTKPKPHVRRNLMMPLSQFSDEMIDGLRRFEDYVHGMSPSDGVACLDFLRQISRELLDGATNFVTTVDAHAQRIEWMKDADRHEHLRAEGRKRNAGD
jgi:hypothetical protein